MVPILLILEARVIDLALAGESCRVTLTFDFVFTLVKIFNLMK